ncbi:unnamed protein product [Linum tenue]|uniref:Uncharacterized protein n=1 Tax=Linum tenue TaxID=586396 RepID=A0AAV0IJW9_9ROSI|nr:unnamed protein product [Linum tenue]
MGCRDLFIPHILLALIMTTFVLIQLSFVYKQHNSTTWSVYHLKSDNEFIRTSKGYPYILVYDYLDDPYLSDVIHANSSRFEPLAVVGRRSSAAPYKALDVLGVTIHGDKLEELMEDLTLVDQTGQTFHLLVNRRGLCLLYVGSRRVMRLRIIVVVRRVGGAAGGEGEASGCSRGCLRSSYS